MYLTRKTIIVASRKVEYDLRRDFQLAIEKQDAVYFSRTPTGSLMAHATNDIAAVREFMGPAIMYSANTATTFVFALVLMLRLDPSITAIALIPLPFIALSTFVLGRKIHFSFKNVQQQFERLTTQSQEVFSGIRIVRAFVREQVERSIFLREANAYLRSNLRLARLQSTMMPAMMLLVGCSQILVLSYGGLRVIEGNATIGTLTQFFIYLNQLIWPVAAIGWVTNIVQRASASSERLSAIMDRVPDIHNDKGLELPAARLDIAFENVSFRYRTSTRDVLSDISLQVPFGSRLGIVGSVGSGKSSLIKLIPRLFDRSSGVISIAGQPLDSIKPSALRSSMGIVLQEAFLFSMSIADNIRLAHPQASDEEVLAVSRLAQLHDEVMSFPKGYQTVIGERGISISGGQKQRLAIARALLGKPSILILDDALSAVDTATEQRLLEGLRQSTHQQTVISVAHRISTVMHCDTIIVLENGRIIEQGTHAQLVEKRGVYADMYQRQLLEEELQISLDEQPSV